MSMKVHFN